MSASHLRVVTAVAPCAALAIALAVAATAQTGGAPAPATASPRRCAGPEHRQFDFWVGRWDVVDTRTQAPAGSSVVELLYDGCTLRENWSEPGFSGGSLNTYDVADRRWHQTWTDSTGAWREFVGGLQDGSMVLVWRHASAREPGKMAEVRMTFSRNADGSVRQYSDQRQGDGPWSARYDYTYRRTDR